MKSHLSLAFFAAVFALLMGSCRESENSRILREADEIIETDPSKSLEILSQADRREFNAGDSAYYALLYTQAQVKSGVRVLSDSLISVAYNYYKDRNEKDLTERAFFYRGMTFFDSNNFREAMKDMLVAYDLANTNNHPYWKAKSAEVISDIFIKVYNYREAEQYRLEAVQNYKLSNRNSNLRYALCDLANIYLNNNKPELAVSILDSLHSLVQSEYPTNFNLLEYMRPSLVACLIETGRADEIKNEYFESIYSDSIPQSVIDRNILLARLACLNENYEAASNAIERAEQAVTTEEQYAHVMYRKYLLQLQENNYRDAAILSDTLLKLQDSLVNKFIEEATGSAISEYYSAKAEKGAEHSKKLSEWLITVSLFSGIALIIFFLIYLLKTRQRKTELEAAMSTVLLLREQAEKINYRNELLSERLKKETDNVTILRKKIDSLSVPQIQNARIVEKLFKEKWSTLNLICNQYFDLSNTEANQKNILRSLDNELKKLRSPKKMKEIEESTNLYMDNIIMKLRDQCNFLKEEDITFLTLIIAGFSVRAVCLLTDIKYKLYYLKRSRLLSRIKASEAPDKELFVQYLS